MPNNVSINNNIHSNHNILNFGSDRYLLTGDHKVVKEYPYSSQFAQDLSKKLMDPERAEHIAKAFEKHIVPIALPLYKGGEALHECREAIKHYAHLLGADAEGMEKVFKEHAHEDVRKFIEAYPVQARNFFNEVAQREGKLNMGAGAPSKKVVILTSSSGGGHVTTANAIKEMMKERGYEAIVLNQDELDKDNDPLKIAKVKYKGEDITMANVYNKVFQQDNDLDTANKLWDIGNEVRKFVPSRQLEKLANKVREINPEMIFSVATHHPEHAALANMTGKKLKYVHTDFDFNNALLPLADKVDPKLINFWVNAGDSEILQGKKVGDWEVPLQELKNKGVIKNAGYPVRPSFVRESDPKKLAQIKESKGIPANDKVVLLSMGRQGIRDHILKYMKMLHDPKNNIEKPMHLVIVCGKNQELKKELEEYIQKLSPNQKHPNVDFKVEGFMDEKAMADYYKVADALISKPGGATAAETAAMGVPMLSVDPHPWELPNQAYLERHGLADKLQSDETFIPQLMGLMAKKQEANVFQPIDWKTQMASLVDGDLNKPMPGLNNQKTMLAFLNMLFKLDQFAKQWMVENTFTHSTPNFVNPAPMISVMA